MKLHNEASFSPGPSTPGKVNQLRAFDARVKTDSVFFVNEIIFFSVFWRSSYYRPVIMTYIAAPIEARTSFHHQAEKAKELTKLKEWYS